MKKSFEDLIKKIITQEDLIFFLEKIILIENLIFKNIEIPLSEKTKGEVGEGFREYLKKLEKQGFLSGSPNQQSSFFKNLKKELQKIPQLKLEIAFEPSDDFLLKIKNWFKKQNNQEVVLDIIINPKIVGGTIIEYQGQYRNFSLVKKMNEAISHTKL